MRRLFGRALLKTVDREIDMKDPLTCILFHIYLGIQTQTAECIVIGEITSDKLIIVLNKVDLIPEEERQDRVDELRYKALPIDSFLLIFVSNYHEIEYDRLIK